MQAKALAAALVVLATVCSTSWAQGPVPLTSGIPLEEGRPAVAVMSGFQELALDFYTLVPCRAVDTRAGAPLPSGTTIAFLIAGTCGVPANAKALAINVTVVGPTAEGFAKLWPADLPEPATSTINFGRAMTRANNAMVPLATDGSGAILFAAFLADSGSVHLIIDVTGYMASEPVTQCQCPTNGTPFSLVFGVSPNSGSVGTVVTISGQNFAPNVQVLFGDATSGSSASIRTRSSTSISATVPPPPPGFTFATEPCDGNGDGIPGGTRNIPTPISVNVRDLDGIGCVATLSNAFMLNPINSSCTGDNSTPPQFADGVENDSDGFIDPFSMATGDMAGVPVTQCECPTNGMPLPEIFGVNPANRSVGSTLAIAGQNFAPNVQVMFGDATTGSSGSIGARSSTSISVIVPMPPPGFTFSTEPCDGNGDGILGGTRRVPTPITVNVRNLDGTGCVATLSNAFTLNPFNTTCTGDTSIPPLPQCSDGIDNDSDGFIDHSSVNPASPDPECASPIDDSEG